MLMADFTSGPGQIGGPANPNAFKRAVYRSAPVKFYVELLAPAKQGSSYSYGMRICPISDGNDVLSLRTNSSSAEYEIWRRWEDLLWFQDTLELEYSILSRAKRNRLQAGKGIKKNGMYIHDAAASFESLPPGPDPNSIAKDIHELIPKLTKKGTLFRASQATIDQRNKEFSALIEALMREDVPALIKELRESRQIRDFFGYWRRDRDLARKIKNAANKSPRASIASSSFSMYFSASTLSLQFPPPITTEIPPSPSLPKSIANSSVSPSGSSSTAGPSSPRGRSILQNSQVRYSRHPSTGVTFNLSNKSSSSDELTSGSSSHRSSVDHKNHEHEFAMVMASSSGPSSDSALDEQTFTLHALPEESELVASVKNVAITDPAEYSPPPRRRARTISHDRSIRNCMVFTNPPQSPNSSIISMAQISERPSMESMRSSLVSPSIIELSETIMADNRFTDVDATSPSSQRSSMVFSGSSSRRSSWQTAMSDIPPRPASSHESYYTRASCADLDLPFTRSPILLHTPLGQMGDFPSRRSRASTLSMASMRTESSADAIIPRTMPSVRTSNVSSVRRSLSVGSKRCDQFSYPSSVMEESESFSEDDEDLIIDSYLDATSLSESDEPSSPKFGDIASGPSTPGPSTPGTPIPATPGRELIAMNLSNPEYFPKPFQNRPSGQFHIPWSPKAAEHEMNPAGNSFAVKAVHGETIIAFRTPRMTSLIEIRKKLVDKFSMQEETPLAHTFALAYMPPPTERVTGAAGRPRSSSVSSIGVSDASQLRFLSSQSSWDDAIATCGGKVMLRIID